MLCFLVVNNTESLKGLCDYPDASSPQTIPSTHTFTYEFTEDCPRIKPGTLPMWASDQICFLKEL